MEDWKLDRIGSAAKGLNPMVIARMKSGFAVIGDTQFLPGYCVLLAYPQVKCLNDLTVTQRSDFLLDMSLLGDAIIKVCNPLKVNYSILGNTDDFLHAHIFPRYNWEEETRRKYPVWLYPKENWTDEKYRYSSDTNGLIRDQLTEAINQLMKGNNCDM
jgi:diadenosine tetraphosphate (Ap4A) HIT family hydrolase